MAFLEDASIDFSTTTGYTISTGLVGMPPAPQPKALFDAGVCHYNTDGFEAGTATVITPALDTSTWTGINRVELDLTEDVGYEHRFLVSFDGSTWLRHEPSGWREVSIDDLHSKGMTAWQLADVRVWDALADSLTFAIGITWDGTEPTTGAIDTIRVFYKTDGTTDTYALEAEPDYSEDLDVVLQGLQPDRPIKKRYVSDGMLNELLTRGGYRIRRAASTKVRRHYPDMQWSGINATQKDTIVAFLRSHYSIPFLWNAPGDSSSLKFVCSEPEVTPPDKGPFTVRTQFLEVF